MYSFKIPKNKKKIINYTNMFCCVFDNFNNTFQKFPSKIIFIYLCDVSGC